MGAVELHPAVIRTRVARPKARRRRILEKRREPRPGGRDKVHGGVRTGAPNEGVRGQVTHKPGPAQAQPSRGRQGRTRGRHPRPTDSPTRRCVEAPACRVGTSEAARRGRQSDRSGGLAMGPGRHGLRPFGVLLCRQFARDRIFGPPPSTSGGGASTRLGTMAGLSVSAKMLSGNRLRCNWGGDPFASLAGGRPMVSLSRSARRSAEAAGRVSVFP